MADGGEGVTKCSECGGGMMNYTENGKFYRACFDCFGGLAQKGVDVALGDRLVAAVGRDSRHGLFALRCG